MPGTTRAGKPGLSAGQAAGPGAQQGGARRWPEWGGGRTEAMRGRRRELTEEPQ